MLGGVGGLCISCCSKRQVVIFWYRLRICKVVFMKGSCEFLKREGDLGPPNVSLYKEEKMQPVWNKTIAILWFSKKLQLMWMEKCWRIWCIRHAGSLTDIVAVVGKKRRHLHFGCVSLARLVSALLCGHFEYGW